MQHLDPFRDGWNTPFKMLNKRQIYKVFSWNASWNLAESIRSRVYKGFDDLLLEKFHKKSQWTTGFISVFERLQNPSFRQVL